MPLGDIIRRSAAKFPDKVALIFGDNRVSYRDLNRRVNRLSASLAELGLRKGDRVAVLLHNSPEFFEIYFATAKSGAIFVPINNLLREGELRQIFEYIEPRFLFLDTDYERMISPMVDTFTFEASIIALKGGDTNAFIPYEDLIDRGKEDEPDIAVSDDDVASIILTSGTTGLPKGAMRTHRHNYINALAGTIELNVRHEDRALLLFPFYHVTFEDSLRYILMANTIVIRREGGFDPEDVLGILSREKITISQLVPTMINALVQEENIGQYDLSHFRLLVYAASPMPVALLKKAMQKFQCDFMQLYGQTESGPIISTLKPEDHVLEGSDEQMARLASAGRPTVTYEVRIVDQDGRDVATGEVGEIVVRSECMTVGYWRLPEETAKAIKDGWLYTGDFGKCDAAGYVYIVDRKHDMIISGGKNIYPREIEELLYKHEAVLECAVIGVPDDYWGESVKALVVLKEGKEAFEEDIIAFCKEHLASYKKPRTVEFRSELPKSPTGKILKRLIREEYWKGKERSV